MVTGDADNLGAMVVGFKDYSDRRDPNMASEAVAQYIRDRIEAEIPEAQVGVFGPPPVRGAGRAGGFALMIEDRGDVGPQVLQQETDNLARMGGNTPGLMALFSVFRANVPQYRIVPNSKQLVMRHCFISTPIGSRIFR